MTNKKSMLAAVVVLAALGASGCYRHHIVLNESVAKQANKHNYDKSKWYHHFLFGLVNGTGEFEASSYCPNGVGKVEDRHAFVTGLVSFLTLNIYTPTRIKVWCNPQTAEQAAATTLPATTVPATVAPAAETPAADASAEPASP